MATFPCANKIVCPGAGNLDYDTPVANLTSELPDRPVYIGYAWGPINAGGELPRLGYTWDALGCAYVCESTVSQEEADQCAQRLASACVWNGTENPITGNPPTIYGNDRVQCTRYCPDGLPFTYSVVENAFLALSKDTANKMARSEACKQAAQRKLCLSALTPASVCLGSSYLAYINVTGPNLNPCLLDIVSGSLPPGLHFIPSGLRQARIWGTPTSAGTYSITVRATDPQGNFMQKGYTICVIEMTSTPTGSDDTHMPNGTVGTAYSATLSAPACATAPLSWQITSGALPTGLSLDEQTGVISGTPSGTAGDYVFVVTLQTSAT